MKEEIGKKKRIKTSLLFLLLLLVMQLTVAFSFAEDGENDGANKDVPLKLEETDPEYGDSTVSLTPTIRMSFSKNVVNFAVKENNSSCFTMTDIEGNPVKISIYFPDDQVEPTEKRNVYITPAEMLKADTQYVITVSDKLTAKSGAKPEGIQQLVFRTVKENLKEEKTPEKDAAATPSLSPSATTPEPLSGEEAPVAGDGELSPAAIEEEPSISSPETADENEGSKDLWFILLPIALLLGAGAFHMRRVKIMRKK